MFHLGIEFEEVHLICFKTEFQDNSYLSEMQKINLQMNKPNIQAENDRTKNSK